MFATTQVSDSFENALKPLAAITLASPVVTQVSQPRATLRCQQPKLFVAVTSANVIPSITPVRTASAMSEVPAISEILTSKTATQPKKKSKSKKAKTAARKVKASRGRGVTVPAATRQRVVLLPVALRPVAVRQAGPKSNGASTTYSFQGPNGKQTVTVRTAVARSKTTYLTRVTTPLKAALATHALNSQTSRASNQDIEVLGVATPTKRATKRSTMPTVEDTFADGTVSEKSAPIAMPELTELPATPQKTDVSELPATPQKTDVSELPATPQKTDVSELPATPQRTDVSELLAAIMPQKTQVTETTMPEMTLTHVTAVPEEVFPVDATFEDIATEEGDIEGDMEDATVQMVDELLELASKRTTA